MGDIKNKKERRVMRHGRVRRKVIGTQQKPRLVVFRSAKHIYAQLVDDETQKTLTGVSTLSPEIKEKVAGMKKIDAAKEVGILISKKVRDLSIDSVVFDRNGYKYHGVVKALGDAVRTEKVLA